MRRAANRQALLDGQLPVVCDVSTNSELTPLTPPTQSHAPSTQTWPLDSKIAIIGAGPGGLSLAYFLQQQGYHRISVLEKESMVGGKARGVWCDGLKPMRLGGPVRDQQGLHNHARSGG